MKTGNNLEIMSKDRRPNDFITFEFESGETDFFNGKKIKGTKHRRTSRGLKHNMKMEKISKYKIEKSMLLRSFFPQI